MTKTLWEQQQQQQIQPPMGEGDSAMSESTDLHLNSLSCLEQARYVEQQLDVTTSLLAEAASCGPVNTPLSLSNPPRSVSPHSDISAPLSSVEQRGTPVALPLNWSVQQANSKVKGLRARAEKVRWTFPPQEDTGERHIDKENKGENEYNSPHPPARKELEVHKRTTAHLTQVRKLQAQLDESLRIICEMDKLVHAALVGNLASAGQCSPHPSLEYSEEEEEDQGVEFELGHVGQMTPGYKLKGSFDPSDWNVGAILPSGKSVLVTVVRASHDACA